MAAVTAYNDMWDIPTEFAFLQCGNRKCGSPLVQWREDLGGGFDNDEPAFFYPAPRRLSAAVPRRLRSAFEEARKCFAAKAYTATLVMVRRALEGTCDDQGATKRTLAESLKELQAKGRIDGTLAEWANLLRVVGNEGAHFTGEEGTAQDAEDALDFAEALLDHLYVLRQRFEDFKGRQEKRERTRAARKTAKKSPAPGKP